MNKSDYWKMEGNTKSIGGKGYDGKSHSSLSDVPASECRS
jgi:hypothetical protein